MLKNLLSIVVLLLLCYLAYMVVFEKSPRDAISSTTSTTSSTTSTTSTVPQPKPECLVDIECGSSNTTDYYCWEGFVVQDHISYACIEDEDGLGRCNKSVKHEYLDWCADGEQCIEGKMICQPYFSCDDGIKNQGEDYIDCGGPCKPCGSCNDGVKNGDEEEIDCGGSCPDCTIACTKNDSCGIDHWAPPYCAKDIDDIDIVIMENITYECRNPGRYSSFCVLKKTRDIIDYCGPLRFCYEGKCYDVDSPDLPFPDNASRGGAQRHWDSRVYTTCIGDNCYKVKTPQN